MKSRFKPDPDVVRRVSGNLIDPTEMESSDASERQFAASLELPEQPPRFVVGESGSRASDVQCSRIHSSQVSLDEESLKTRRECSNPNFKNVGKNEPSGKDLSGRDLSGREQGYALQSDESRTDVSSWQQQVAQRLSSYQSRRRPREPRYPSLQLKFESEKMERCSSLAVNPNPVSSTDRRTSSLVSNTSSSAAMESLPGKSFTVETTGRVIEFPRSAFAPPSRSDELAEPVFEKPRIMEAPEIPLPTPSLGGILIETTEAPANEKRPGFELPLQPARMGRRVGAMVIDSLIVATALALFGCIFWRVVTVIPPFRIAAVTAAGIAAIFWAAYQYLLTVYCGNTPGLQLAKLKLSRFDGSSVPRKIRRWRVLACILSGLSLGLGYAWCFLDEDRLCWHDRITRTYMAPKG